MFLKINPEIILFIILFFIFSCQFGLLCARTPLKVPRETKQMCVFSCAGVRIQHSGCRVQHLGFSIQGSGFRAQGSGFRAQGPGFITQGSGFSIQGSGFSIQKLGFRVQGAAFMVQGSESHQFRLQRPEFQPSGLRGEIRTGRYMDDPANGSGFGIQGLAFRF